MSKKSTKDILQAPRGMRDFYGDEYKIRQGFFSTAQKIAEHYGFSGIETPIMEHTEIFYKGVGEGTDIVDKEMYNLETAGGDRLTLRPEGTAAIMRAYIEHGMGSLPGPQMFHYSGPFFRHEKPQKGRYRQLYQFGLEIMGSKNPLHDALIIQTGYEILVTSGRKILIEINSLGNNDERAEYIEKLRSFYHEHINEIGESDKNRIVTNPLRILDSKDTATLLINKKAPILLDSLGAESRKYFDTVLSYLDALEIPYKIITSLVRGLDYYEHTVFEYVTLDDHEKKSHALGGGGRYDGLAEKIGHNRSVPSVGLGLGADRIVEIAKPQSFRKNEQTKNICFISLDEKSHAQSLIIAKQLQEKNIPVYFMFSNAKAGKQFEKAEKMFMKYALVLGENELEKNIIILKNLETREQSEIELNNLESELQKL